MSLIGGPLFRCEVCPLFALLCRMFVAYLVYYENLEFDVLVFIAGICSLMRVRKVLPVCPMCFN
jgi:hypothetical protein